MRQTCTPWTLVVAATLVATGAGSATPLLSGARQDAPDHRLDPDAIRRADGQEPSVAADGVVRLTWPRDDVAVRVDGVALHPAAGLTSWAAFAPAGEGAMLMGDTVVFEDEVDAAMDAAFEHGLEVTGLHNHFFFDRPKAFFMHVGGHGEPADLAAGVKATWDAIKEVRRARPAPADGFGGGTPASGELDADALAEALGREVTHQAGVVKVTIGREGSMGGVRVGASMGLTTWAAFSGSDVNAAIDGDFIMTAPEVQPVLRALRAAGLHVVALHNHMTGETPAYYFVHFWGKGPALELARGFRSVLDSQAAATRDRDAP